MHITIENSCSSIKTASLQIYKEASKILLVALDALKKLATYIFLGAKQYLSSNTRIFIQCSSILWSWKLQALYLRVEILYSEMVHYFDQRGTKQKEEKLKSIVQQQAALIAQLERDLVQATGELPVYRKEVLDGFKSQIETAIKHDEVSKQLEKEKLSTYRLELKTKIQEDEAEFLALIKKVLDRYEEVVKADDVSLGTELRYAIEILIPSWKAHLKTNIQTCQNLIDRMPDRSIDKRIMQRIIELAKTPPALTELVLKMNTCVQAKLKLASNSGEEILSQSEIDQRLAGSVNEFIEAIKKSQHRLATSVLRESAEV